MRLTTEGGCDCSSTTASAGLNAPAPREAFVADANSESTANRQQSGVFKYLKRMLAGSARAASCRAACHVQRNKRRNYTGVFGSKMTTEIGGVFGQFEIIAQIGSIFNAFSPASLS